MINIDEIYIINYCHPNCTPLKNIVRLPEEEAFALAKQMSECNVATTAFWRFADFENYYPRRIKADEYLYDSFKKLGGKPTTAHPLSFVLHGSDFLNNWFGNGYITKLLLKDIASEHISFTHGDSCATLERTGNISIFTKETLLQSMLNYAGTLEQYMNDIEQSCHYIEVQLWSDDYIASPQG